MRVIRYQFLSAVVDNVPYFIGKTIPFSEEGEEIAKVEAYNGEYEVYDDGLPEPKPTPSVEERVDSLEESSTEMQQAIDVLLLGAL